MQPPNETEIAEAGAKLQRLRAALNNVLFGQEALIDGVLTVTLWYDGGNAPAIVPTNNAPIGGGNVTIPKTGEAPPYGNYALAVLCMGVAGMCGMALYRDRKRKPGVV